MLPESITSIFSGKQGPLSYEELEMGEAMKALEFAIFKELNDCLDEAENNMISINPELARITSELQCALDIVLSARTKEERQRAPIFKGSMALY